MRASTACFALFSFATFALAVPVEVTPRCVATREPFVVQVLDESHPDEGSGAINMHANYGNRQFIVSQHLDSNHNPTNRNFSVITFTNIPASAHTCTLMQ